jgi:vacuolar-type H+-ATPase subunit H
MSTNYADTLKRIKEAEETSNREVAEKKKSLETELHEIEKVADESIELTKKEAELYVTHEVEDARKSAQKDADGMLATSRRKADEIASKKLEKKEFRRVIDDIVLSEFKSE